MESNEYLYKADLRKSLTDLIHEGKLVEKELEILIPTGGVVSKKEFEEVAKYKSGLINVKEIGAKGDGVTDDTEVLRTALTTYTDVYIPDGIYIISDTLFFENSILFYSSDGYKSRTLTMDKSVVIKIKTNKDCLVMRGSNMKITGGTLTYSEIGYNSDLLKLESLKENSIKITCNNVIDSLYLISQYNVSLIPNGEDFYGNGIHMISNGTHAMYSNRFINCYVADLKHGLLIENGSTVGINGNSFDLSIWNCNCLCSTNGNGNVFSGNLQSGRPGKDSELASIECKGSYNNFLWYLWDVGQFPHTNKYSYNFWEGKINNCIVQTVFGETLKGNYVENNINFAIKGDVTKQFDKYRCNIPFNLRTGSNVKEIVIDSMNQSDNSINNIKYVDVITPRYTNLKSNLGESIGSIYNLDSNFMPIDLVPLTEFQEKSLSFSKMVDSEVGVMEFDIHLKNPINNLFPRAIFINSTHANNCLKECVIDVIAHFGNSSLRTRSYVEQATLSEIPRNFYRYFILTDNSYMQDSYRSDLIKITVRIEVPKGKTTDLTFNRLHGSLADYACGYIPNK